VTTKPRKTQWKLHVTLAVGLAICVVALIIEISRATNGHWPAWVYVFEWPLFAAFGTYTWWRLVHATDDELPLGEIPAADATRTLPRPHSAPTNAQASDDPQLRAWEAYVERLQAKESEDGSTT